MSSCLLTLKTSLPHQHLTINIMCNRYLISFSFKMLKHHWNKICPSLSLLYHPHNFAYNSHWLSSVGFFQWKLISEIVSVLAVAWVVPCYHGLMKLILHSNAGATEISAVWHHHGSWIFSNAHKRQLTAHPGCGVSSGLSFGSQRFGLNLSLSYQFIILRNSTRRNNPLLVDLDLSRHMVSAGYNEVIVRFGQPCLCYMLSNIMLGVYMHFQTLDHLIL